MKTKLNIFLAKAEKDIEDLIKSYEDDSLLHLNVTNGTFYYKEAQDKVPRWVENFFGEDLQGEDLCNKSIQAVFLTEVEVSEGTTRYFAITFGLGRNILILDNFEESFGLTTTLNLVNENELRSLDTNSLGNGSVKHFIQMGHSSSLKDFDIDLEKDLVKNLSGKLTDENLPGDAKSICGKQSVSISANVDTSNIHDFLRSLYGHYQRQDYLQRFPGMNNAKVIKEKSRIEELDNQMLRAFNDEINDEFNIEISLPELRLNHEIGTFTYGSSDTHHSELDLYDLKTDLNSTMRGQQISIPTLKNRHIRVFSGDGNMIDKWSIYNCLSVDLRDRNKQYVLNEGKWYSFDLDYVNNINSFYESIELSDISLSEYRDHGHLKETENDYNERICNNNEQLELMDCQCINIHNQTQFEVCDIFDKQRMSFIHIKHNTGSSMLSHLSLQGVVSGELMLYKSVRDELLSKKANLDSQIYSDIYSASNYEVVYAIIDRSKASRNRYQDDRPHLPFFSKISLRHAVNILRNYGYNVKLKRIKWSE